MISGSIEHPILILMGVAGCGKTTMAEYLVDRVGWEYAEADDFHPQANIDKMAAGHPLNDDDRWPWLRLIAAWIDEHIAEGRPAIVTCSALKKVYRDLLARPEVVFVHLDGSFDTINERIEGRRDHFMKPEMLTSQFDTLERLEDSEQGIVVDVLQSRLEKSEIILNAVGISTVSHE